MEIWCGKWITTDNLMARAKPIAVLRMRKPANAYLTLARRQTRRLTGIERTG